jgi:N-acetylneuraminate synthase
VTFAENLQQLTGATVPIVGSFSVLGDLSPREFYERYHELFDTYRRRDLQLLPQWLPPIAWYFGGSVPLTVMNDVFAIEMIEKLGTRICLDACHLLMCDAFGTFDATGALRKLSPFIDHVHLAEADGVDGEGLAIGSGSDSPLGVFSTLLGLPCMKVIEVWQGHLNDFHGFAESLVNLKRIYGRNGFAPHRAALE